MKKFEYLNVKLAFDVMKTPTYSEMEYRMISFIINWANSNNVDYYLDDFGNIYLTKGKVNDGEYFPCVTSHMDSVQKGHVPYILKGQKLQIQSVDIKDKINDATKSKIYVRHMGVGGDDKCGILVSLDLFKYFDKLKAVFFVEEEIGCKGSEKADISFFDDVGYVIGWDSPEVNRNCWSSGGKKLFTYDFYEKHMKEVCDNNGRTLFYSEPFTDVRELRGKVDIACMNFGSGGYNAHMKDEYAILDDIDVSIKFGKELIEKLGLNRYAIPKNLSSYSYKIAEDKKLVPDDFNNEDDNEKLRSLGDRNKYSDYYGVKDNDYDEYDYDEYDDYDYGEYDYDAQTDLISREDLSYFSEYFNDELKDGKSLEEIFTYVYETKYGMTCVAFNNFYNFVNSNNKLVLSEWVDYASNFDNGFSTIRCGGRVAILMPNGELLGDTVKWFKYVSSLHKSSNDKNKDFFICGGFDGINYRVQVDGKVENLFKVIINSKDHD